MSATSLPLAPTLSSLRWPLAMAVALVLAACSPPADSPGSTAASENPAAPAGSPAHASLGLEELRTRGRVALRDQRIYAPAGDNAMEYYIALRDGSKGSDESAANALMELQPYAVIAAEQALARGDFIEAERLRRLLAAADPRAPSLARIASAIARGLLAETQTVRVETPATGDAESLVAAAPASASTTPSTRDEAPAAIPAPSSSAIAAAPVSTAPQVTVAGPVDALTPTPAPIPARQANPAPAQAPSRVALVPVRTPQPEYPADKRQKGAVGQVLASFTVNSDGTVGEVRTESIGSRQISFERSVAQAVKRWKYQPPGESRSVTQSFSFAP